MEMNQHNSQNEVNLSQNASQAGSPKYWMSLEQWRNDPEFLKFAEQEFRSTPFSDEEGAEGGWARREFLKLMGASMALTTFGCIRRPVQKIVPYAKHPHEVVIGVANYYASSFVDGVEAMGLVVRTREGRPIKVEGNTRDQNTKGGASVRAQAHILSLYDPDRLTGPKRNLLNEKRTNRDTVAVDWESADGKIAQQLKKGGVALVTGDIASPSTRKLVGEFTSAFRAQHYQWEAITYDSLVEAQEMSYGEAVVPQYHFDKAQYIVSIGADFLGTYLTPVQFNRAFTIGRKPSEKMNRLVAFEPIMTLTGANADIRFRVSVQDQLKVAMGLLHEIIVKKGWSRFAGDSIIKGVLAPFENAAAEMQIKPEDFAAIAAGLWENRGQSMVIAGGLSSENAMAVQLQVAVNLLNAALDNDGKTITSSSGDWKGRSRQSAMAKLLEDVQKGNIKTVIFHGVNPAYAYGRAPQLEEALAAKVEMVISTSAWMDETSRISHFVVPDHHMMENWGDVDLGNGQVTIQQPTIRPLYDTRAFQDSMMAWMKKAGVGGAVAASWFDYLQNQWKAKASGKSFDDFWVELLQNGTWGEPTTKGGRSFRPASVSALKDLKIEDGGVQLALYATSGLRDGSLANISWLQEFPDPVTKICWDNYLCVSPKAAEAMNLQEGQFVKLTMKVSDKSVEISVPAHIQPGQHDKVVALAVGYGRSAAGKVGNGIGLNAFALSTANGERQLFAGMPVQVVASKGVYPLANVQGHNYMEGRQIVVEATLKDYQKNHGAGIHRHKMVTMWSGHKYEGHKWGLAVDLNSCTGCGACVIACQSENNIPVVGKRYVIEGREMAWIRIDRYFKGEPENPEVVHQPVMCHHCDNAPCETVCPVAATTHSPEGLNEMTYNRCVGTRYCSNNCPYKVRRFNWFNHQNANRNPYATSQAPLNRVLNPEVTVRTRGVMEKCTFCVQRIHEAKNHARDLNVKLKDGDIRTACQQTCPTDALVFGDMNDPNSRVSQMFKEERTYKLLEEWNTEPAVRYMTKIRNNGKESAGAEHHGNEGHHS